MSEELLEQGAATVPAVDTTATENPPAVADASVTSEESGETDEQKNERVQREAAEKAEKRARGVQKRIDELTADKHNERKRADDLAQQNARILALLEGKSAKAEPAGEPTREQYEDYETYTKALARYEAKQVAKELLEESTKTQREAQQKLSQEQSEQSLMREHLKRQAEIAKTIPDFHEVMADSDISLPNTVLRTLMRMPDGNLIGYHMAKQPALAQQFWDADPEMHGIILGQLSATLKGAPKVSTAPAPGKTVTSKPAASDGPPSDPAMYRAWADKHMPK